MLISSLRNWRSKEGDAIDKQTIEPKHIQFIDNMPNMGPPNYVDCPDGYELYGPDGEKAPKANGPFSVYEVGQKCVAKGSD